VTDTPNGAVAVFTEKQRAVFRDSNPDRPTPDTAIAHHEANNEIFVIAEHFASRVVKRHAHDFITSVPRTIPVPWSAAKMSPLYSAGNCSPV
jgi:hypothetical protein